MATYTLKGQRFLRKYTEGNTSPVYAAATEVSRIASCLAGLDWKKATATEARMTYHTNEVVYTASDGTTVTGLDMNVRIRDQFDAALFCAEHVSEQHRAYANAAVYRYTLPDAAVGKSLTSLVATVTSDPYNSNGARLHVYTNSTGVIPTDCATCRGNDASGVALTDGTVATGVAKRGERTVNKTTYWDPTTESCTLAPTGGLTLQKYLFVFVLMEDYATVRGNWIEGCSFIENAVKVTTSAAVSGWTDGETYDLSASSDDATYAVCDKGEGVSVGARTVTSDSTGLIGRQAAYYSFLGGDGEWAASSTRGAYFRTRRTVKGTEIEAGLLLVPLVLPDGFTPTRVKLDFSRLSMTSGAVYRVYLADSYLTALTDETLKASALYDGKDSVSGLTSLGEIASGTSASFDLPDSLERFATLVISAFMPPDSASATPDTTWQGTPSKFLPSVSIS